VSIGESTRNGRVLPTAGNDHKEINPRKGFKMVILESPYDDIELLNKDLMTSSIELNQNIYFQYIKPKKNLFLL
jgi:hypothetical protein